MRVWASYAAWRRWRSCTASFGARKRLNSRAYPAGFVPPLPASCWERSRLWYPEVLGVGYEVTDNALSGTLPLLFLVACLAAKIVATSVSLGFGFGGGVFSPSLTVGALVGGAFGIVATNAFPELSSGSGAYAVVGMGAVSSAVLGAPISTVLIIFELTSDYGLTIAVMVAVVIANVMTAQLGGITKLVSLVPGAPWTARWRARSASPQDPACA